MGCGHRCDRRCRICDHRSDAAACTAGKRKGGSVCGGRAQKHVEAIARAPHPMGSPESVRVRQTIMRKLEEIGLEPEGQKPRLAGQEIPYNVLARMKGQGAPGKKALLLAAHYDSVSDGPGASDNAAGVAVVLETLRAA